MCVIFTGAFLVFCSSQTDLSGLHSSHFVTPLVSAILSATRVHELDVCGSTVQFKWLQILLGSEIPRRYTESFDPFLFIKAENLGLPSLKSKRIQEIRLYSVMAITVLAVFRQEGAHLGCKWRRM